MDGRTITAFSLGMILALPVAARLADRFGRRPVFLVSVAIFTTASLACGVASNIYLLVGLRAVQATIAAVALLAFAHCTHHASDPFIPPRLLHGPGFGATNAINFLYGGATAGLRLRRDRAPPRSRPSRGRPCRHLRRVRYHPARRDHVVEPDQGAVIRNREARFGDRVEAPERTRRHRRTR